MANAASDCTDVGCVVEPLVSLLGPLALVFPVGLAADVYYTPGILANAIGGTAPTVRRAKNQVYWTAWQGALLGAGAAHAATNDNLGIAAMPLLALATWPLAITAQGAWYWAADRPAVQYSMFGVLIAGDAALLAYDVVGLARGESFTPSYAILESWTGALQTTYGLATASHQTGSDLVTALALSSGPVLLLTHGVTSLIAGHQPTVRPPRPDLRRLTLVPSLAPRADGGIELTVAGTFW